MIQDQKSEFCGKGFWRHMRGHKSENESKVTVLGSREDGLQEDIVWSLLGVYMEESRSL